MNSLLVFEAVIRCGNFSSAAKELGVTGPAVSRTIARLESYLGLTVFERTPTGASPTTAGDELFSGIARGLQGIEETIVRLKRDSGAAENPVTLSVSPAFATYWFVPRLAKFKSTFPSEEIRFELTGGQASSPAGAYLAMDFDRAPESGIHIRDLMPELLVPVSAPGFAAQPRLVEFLLEIFADAVASNRLDVLRTNIFAPGGPAVGGRLTQLSDYVLVVQAALAGQGVAFGSLAMVSTLLAEGKLVPVGTRVLSTNRRYQLVTSQDGSETAGRIAAWISDELAIDIDAMREAYPRIEIERSEHAPVS